MLMTFLSNQKKKDCQGFLHLKTITIIIETEQMGGF